jgi:hypothetical protein
MRRRLATWVLAAAAILLLASPTKAPAQDTRPAGPPPSCNCPGQQLTPRAPRPRFADHSRQPLDIYDEVAALDAIRIALTQVGDGNSFVWYRNNGRLSGVVQPTRSFKDVSGRVCRHIVVILTTGPRTGRIEGMACRLSDGGWQLDG